MKGRMVTILLLVCILCQSSNAQTRSKEECEAICEVQARDQLAACQKTCANLPTKAQLEEQKKDIDSEVNKQCHTECERQRLSYINSNPFQFSSVQVQDAANRLYQNCMQTNCNALPTSRGDVSPQCLTTCAQQRYDQTVQGKSRTEAQTQFLICINKCSTLEEKHIVSSECLSGCENRRYAASQTGSRPDQLHTWYIDCISKVSSYCPAVVDGPFNFGGASFGCVKKCDVSRKNEELSTYNFNQPVIQGQISKRFVDCINSCPKKRAGSELVKTNCQKSCDRDRQNWINQNLPVDMINRGYDQCNNNCNGGLSTTQTAQVTTCRQWASTLLSLYRKGGEMNSAQLKVLTERAAQSCGTTIKWQSPIQYPSQVAGQNPYQYVNQYPVQNPNQYPAQYPNQVVYG